MESVRAFVVLLGLACVGCAEGEAALDDGRLPCPPTHYSCDIAEPDCAAGVLDLTACVRGDELPELPKINRLTAAQFGEQLRREDEEDKAGPSPWDPVLRALGLLPASETLREAAIAQAVDSVAAFYDPETKQVSVITDAGSEHADPRERMYVLAHEFTHLLQDRAHDLLKLDKQASSSTDRAMALGMLVEGEATVTSTRVLLRLMRRSPEDFDFPRFFDSLEESLLEGIVSAPSPLAATMQSLSYSAGGRYVAKVWDQRGRSAVDDLFEAAPLTAADWLALDTDNPTATRARPLDCAPPLAPEGFELYELDRLGAAGVLAMLASIDKVELELAGELVDDAFALYVERGAADPAAAPVIGVWRMRFRSPKATDRFFALFQARGIGLRRSGSELVMRVSSGDALTELTGDALDACPAMDELEPKHSASSQPNAALKRLWH